MQKTLDAQLMTSHAHKSERAIGISSCQLYTKYVKQITKCIQFCAMWLEPLYNSDLTSFYEKLDEILVNAGGSTKKKEEGKLFKLNNYVNDKLKTYPSVKIIPILVTEKNLGGGVEFFKLIGFDVIKKIDDNNLTALKNCLPLFISLDDLENFWSVSDQNKNYAIKEFIDLAIRWQENPHIQPSHLYNFGYYVNSELLSRRTSNPECSSFFSFLGFLDSLN